MRFVINFAQKEINKFIEGVFFTANVVFAEYFGKFVIFAIFSAFAARVFLGNFFKIVKIKGSFACVIGVKFRLKNPFFFGSKFVNVTPDLKNLRHGFSVVIAF